MIVVRLKGGTGNQMFQYAFGRRIARDLQCELALDLSFLESTEHDELHVRREYSLDIFGVNGPFYEGNIHSDLKWVVEKTFSYDPEIIPKAGEHLLLDGYWQTSKYFEPIAEEIWQQFAVSSISQLDHTLVEQFQHPNSVCLNVRRGDFVHNQRSRDFHGVLGLEYIEKAFSLMKSKVSQPRVFVFSDDVEWCKKSIRMDGPVQVIGHEYAGEKFVNYLHYMSLFQNYIIPNSSFAWWAVWLSCFHENDRNVIAPQNWFLDDSYRFDDLIPESWVRI